MLTSFYQFRVPSLPKKNKHSASKPPLLHRNTIVSSKHDKPMCAFEDRNHKSLTPDPSANDNTRGQQDNKEAEIADEEEGFGGDSERDTLPYLYPTKKRSLCRVGVKPHEKRPIKYYPFSSRLSSDAETGTGDESDISSYTPTKSRHISKPRPISSHLTSLEGDTSDDGAINLAGRRSRMTVIYEQQSWKGKIVQERDVKQGRRRPRKQYRIQWETSWVDSACLTVPETLQSWKEKKALKSKH